MNIFKKFRVAIPKQNVFAFVRLCLQGECILCVNADFASGGSSVGSKCEWLRD